MIMIMIMIMIMTMIMIMIITFSQSHYSGNLKNNIQIDDLKDLSTQQLADVIIVALFEPLEE